MTSRKIRHYRGTFDPVHYGHLVAAQYAAYGFHLTGLFLCPQLNHLIRMLKVLDARHRVAMVELAIADNPAFEMSTLEWVLGYPIP